MSTISKLLASPPDNFSTTLSSGINSSALTIPLNSVSGLPTEGIGVLYAKDSNGDVDVTTIEFIHWTNISGSNLTLSDTNDRGITGSFNGAQSHAATSTYFEVWVSQNYYAGLRAALANLADATTGALDTTKVFDLTSSQTATNKSFNSLVINTSVSGTAILDEDNMASDSATKLATQQSIKAYVDAVAGVITTSKFLPQGTANNYRIATSVSSNNLTVALKGMDGNDPSAQNPVHVRIGNTVRTITSALSVTKNAGTNWFNSGSTDLANNEVDYFVYLGYNATDGVVIGFSRIPYARVYGDFNTTTTNDKYCAISTITNAASTDEYELIGRFNAMLSATASFNWSIPATSIIINRPIFTTRPLTWSPTLSASGSMTISSPTINSARYVVSNQDVNLELSAGATTGGTASKDINFTLPFTAGTAQTFFGIGSGYVGDGSQYLAGLHLNSSTTSCSIMKYNETNWALTSVSIFGANAKYSIA